ncbi:hypothetical protein FRB90_005805 [Tulasnella sp. 427]|nr:hypothetical protein FRB90_005805 [Tulasnella sp. 427]
MPVFSKIKTTLSAALALTSAVVHATPLQSSSLYETFHDDDGDHSLLSRFANATYPLTPPTVASSATGVSPDVEAVALSYMSQQTSIPQDSLSSERVHQRPRHDPCISHAAAGWDSSRQRLVRQYRQSHPVRSIMVKAGTSSSIPPLWFAIIQLGSSSLQTKSLLQKPTLSQAATVTLAEVSLGLALLSDITISLSYVIQPLSVLEMLSVGWSAWKLGVVES